MEARVVCERANERASRGRAWAVAPPLCGARLDLFSALLLVSPCVPSFSGDGVSDFDGALSLHFLPLHMYYSVSASVIASLSE